MKAVQVRLRLVHRIRDPGVLHLFPGLLTPSHVDRGIGIPLVVRGIVVVSDRFQARALGHCDGLCEDVVRLLVEIVVRHGQHDVIAAIGIYKTIFPAVAAQMRVREKSPDMRVLVERNGSGNGRI